MRILIIILAIINLSCSARWHMKQLEKKGAIERDTVFQTVQIVVPETKFDTVVNNVNFIDTVVVTKDKVITKVKINTIEKQVFVSTKCPEKIIEKKIPYAVTTNICSGPGFWNILKWILIGIAIGFILCLVFKNY